MTALRPPIGAINILLMRDANARASADATSPDRAARCDVGAIENTR
jgi:hypothetical protein